MLVIGQGKATKPAICAASAAEAARITTTRTKLANPRGEEEIHLVVQTGQVTPGQLLDPPDPVAHGGYQVLAGA